MLDELRSIHLTITPNEGYDMDDIIDTICDALLKREDIHFVSAVYNHNREETD